jgi:stress-induced-phosphoprotein 1
MIDVLGALMGIDLQASTRPEGSDELPSDIQNDSPPPPAAPTPSSSKTKSPDLAPEQEDIEMEDDDETRAKRGAEVAKEAGNAAYKNRDFEEAAKQFQLAWDTWPKNVAYLTNLGGEHFIYSIKFFFHLLISGYFSRLL